MTSPPERNDRRPPAGRAFHGRPGHGAKGHDAKGHDAKGHDPKNQGRRAKGGAGDAAQWVWGVHAVEAALANPDRPEPELLLAAPDHAQRLAALRPGVRVEQAQPQDIARRLGAAGAVHQGVALKTPPLNGVALADLAQPAEGVLVMLDQVTDPQNVGAILRSAAAFGARGVVMQERRAPPLGGALAKAAAGALERVACARVVNLSRALETLSGAGWRIVGLAGAGDTPLAEAVDEGAVVLVLGSEGEGLRRLVAEHCDVAASIAMPGGVESLNVAAAAAVALYAASLTRRGVPRRRAGAARIGARVTGERN